MQDSNLCFKYSLEKAVPRTGQGGTTRGASVKEFPASIGIAGVSMRLMPGAIRELHWHANAAEWAYVVKGQVRTTVIHPDGSSYIDIFNPGDVWYFPKGYGHALQGIGTEECHFILIFDNGNFSEDHTFSITDFVSSVPKEVAAKNLNISTEEVEQLFQGETYFAQCEPPTFQNHLLPRRSEEALKSMHRYPLLAQQPKMFAGGLQRVVTRTEFPISQTMAGSVLEIQPGCMREMHWHPGADEWQYFLEGTAEMGVFLAQSTIVIDQYEAGDIGYAPMGAGHYIKNTGSSVLKVLVGFNNGDYESIDLSSWIGANPLDILEGNFHTSKAMVEKFTNKDNIVIIE
ncbi:cupin domain-containing protein [Chitinophaga silvatica]|uniref:Cupin domain-containing protein n=1 Tax=Chitinophaga silvatica TaxID=2282649 RepID=A0A3E1Y5U2_9BACT|nr:cupin domain-containing protein [Chitinophaga silvatica]RFS20095.1 cupin domain-containing protein [Chitinophaga silvatica]